MCDFEPGDVVVCVDGSPPKYNNTRLQEAVRDARVFEGRMYNVIEVIEFIAFPVGVSSGNPGVHVSDPEAKWDHPLGQPGSWKPERFRKVYKPKPDFLENLMKEPTNA